MIFKKQQYLLSIKVIGIFILLWLTGCGSEVTVVNKSTAVSSMPILENSDQWKVLTWLSPSKIFLGKLDLELGPQLEGRIYDLQKKTWQILTFEDVDCPQGELVIWSRLPDGRLGFIYYCREERLMLHETANYLVAWDYEANLFEILQEYPEALHSSFTMSLGIPPRKFPQRFHPYTFAVKPDFTVVIQQEDRIRNFAPTLYYVSLPEGDISPFLSDLERAASPSWSSDGQSIAFVGSLTKPSLTGNIFSGLPSIRAGLRHPWNLYVMDAEGQNVRQILSKIVDPLFVKWSPVDNQRIAFLGDYQGLSGLWLYELEQKHLVFLWPSVVSYDWSPDGQKMILNICKSDNPNDPPQLPRCTPTIIEVP